jgi:hypothetical protein
MSESNPETKEAVIEIIVNGRRTGSWKMKDGEEAEVAGRQITKYANGVLNGKGGLRSS